MSTHQTSRFNLALLRRFTQLMASVLAIAAMTILTGCERTLDPPDPVPMAEVITTQVDNFSTKLEEEQEDSFLKKAGDALEKATSSGSEAGQWVQEKLGGAAESSGQTAEDTLKWASETFESLRSQGLTTANDTGQWLTQDFNAMESWQYKVITLGELSDEDATAKLNELGSEGWECIQTDGSRFFFKKPGHSYLRRLPFKDIIRLVPLMNQGK